jgi:hypothetical protein
MVNKAIVVVLARIAHHVASARTWGNIVVGHQMSGPWRALFQFMIDCRDLLVLVECLGDFLETCLGGDLT